MKINEIVFGQYSSTIHSSFTRVLLDTELQFNMIDNDGRSSRPQWGRVTDDNVYNTK